jgi:diadenosine tetraphosphate (Ap4A) HIT family hydrolase
MSSCCDIWTKFGHESGEILSTVYWSVVIRRKQVTPGSLVLICKRHAESLGSLTPEEGEDLPNAARAIEQLLDAAFQPDKLNYLALMMVDRHLHFHVIPRYERERTVHGYLFKDPNWGGPPRLDAETPEDRVVDAVLADLRAAHRNS